MAPQRSHLRRQPLLLTTPSPLLERLGEGFFRNLPRQPGVYFFRDAAGQLLYIGQSGCLRNRLGSYRHVDPDRHPRRSLRLIQRTVSIEWQLCATAAEAIALEAALLLEHRPPFNRAGVWPAVSWWLHWEEEEAFLQLRLSQTPDPDTSGTWHGPLSARFRHAFPALVRCLHRAMYPRQAPWEYPTGFFKAESFRSAVCRLEPESAPLLTQLRSFLANPTTELHATLAEAHAAFPCPASLDSFWLEQLQQVEDLTTAPRKKS